MRGGRSGWQRRIGGECSERVGPEWTLAVGLGCGELGSDRLSPCERVLQPLGDGAIERANDQLGRGGQLAARLRLHHEVQALARAGERHVERREVVEQPSPPLVALEDAADRRPVLDNLMRAAHSLKGAAQIVGLTPLVKLAHTMEDLFVAALAGTLEVTPAAVDVLLGASDFFAELSAGDTASFNQRAPEIPGWITKLADIRAGRLPESAPAADAATPAPAPAPAPGPAAAHPAP